MSNGLDLSYLLTGLMTKTTGSNLTASVGGRIYLDEAPEGVVFPYVVFFIVSDTPDNRFAKYGEDILLQFSIFSTSKGATEITGIYRDLIALFDDCTLTVTSNTVINMARENTTTMIDEITTPEGTSSVRHWAVDYRILTEAT